jgi:hypothetical protein
MSQPELEEELTHRAMLVLCRQFAQRIGLIEVIEATPLRQKRGSTDRKPRYWSFWSPFSRVWLI